MSRIPQKFVNPSNSTEYVWPINHSEEDSVGKRRNIQESANTGNTGLVKQQGDQVPLVLKYTGTILKKSQVAAFIEWFQLCDSQTIYFYDFAGDQYEVIITAFEPIRLRTIKNPKDQANAPFHYWHYSIEMEVIKVISGVWAGVTP